MKAFPKRRKIHANPSSKALAKIPKQEGGEEAGGEQIHSQNPHVLELSGFPYCSFLESGIRADSASPWPTGWFVSLLPWAWAPVFDRPLAMLFSTPPLISINQEILSGP